MRPAAPPRVTVPEPAAPPLPPLVLPDPSIPPEVIKPASARFEPLNLEPFIKQADLGEPLPPQRVPTSPEDFIADREEDDDSDAFAPGADFDALPPPLDPVPDPLPPISPPPTVERATSNRTWVVLGSILAVLAVGGYAWKVTHSSDTASVEQPAPGVAPQPAPARSAADPSRPASAQAAPAATALQSEVVTTQRAWVRVIADGQRVVERELPANSRIPFDAQKTIQIRTGNAGAVRLTIRGVDKGALGRIGEVVTRSFSVTQ